ncbi:MAG: sulfide/dihydroorotate dehydrogenase-like FAD/NAD-binding protein [Clostridia bacterium]
MKIVKKRVLAPNVNEYEFEAPLVARHAKPGQFIILIVEKDGERVPFTICDINKPKGTITILVQTIGYSTQKLAELEVGDSVSDLVGPLGNATDLSQYKNVLLIGGGIGSAVIFPQAKFRKEAGLPCDVIVGAKTKELIMYENEFLANTKNLYIVTDDGSYGDKGFVTTKFEELMAKGNKYDVVLAVGPMIMMKVVCEATKKYNLHTIISMNSVMVDGTGMCGGCRVIVGGETKYACVDGPEFDGHLVNWDIAMNRSRFYTEHEGKCKLRSK